MIIETERLILRPFLEGDAADVYEYLKAPAVNCFAGMRLRSLDEAQEEVQKRLLDAEQKLPGQGIRLRGGPRVLRLPLLPKGRTADLRLHRGLQPVQPASVREAGDAPGGPVPGVRLLREPSRRHAQV